MDRAAYNDCMRPYMTGSKSKEQRQQDMCIGAKLCTGKAETQEQAVKLCEEAAANPKPPKAKKGRKVCTLKDLEAISVCMAENINLSQLTTKNMHEVFSEALEKCSGASRKKVKSAKQTLETMDPKQIEALETIAKLSKQFEGKQW